MSQGAGEKELTNQDRKLQFKLAVYKFMNYEKQGINIEYFTFEELKKSTFLSKYTEDDIKFWIQNTLQFMYDGERYVYCLH